MEYSALEGSSHLPWWKNKKIVIGVGVLVGIVIVMAVVAVAVAVSDSDDDKKLTPVPEPNNLEEAIVLENIMEHLSSLQEIADENSGSRTAITGYNASVAYVWDLLQEEKDFYNVTLQEFEFPFYTELAPPQFLQVSPMNVTYRFTNDFRALRFCVTGDITAAIQPAGDGCQDTDYADFDEGSIALITKSDCTIPDKIALAEKYNASGVIVIADALGLFTRGLSNMSPFPAFSVTAQLGQDLLEVYEAFKGTANALKVRMFANTSAPIVVTMNVLAESYSGNPNNTIVVGSHLDSVLAGPGINDNGSGSSVNLELALQLAALMERGKVTLANRVRFAWWAAEEFGLVGSYYYVQQLNSTNPAELHKIALNLNFDMLGSPNYYRGVYNGSAHDVGSGQIQNLFEEYFASVNLTTEPKPFNERSDYAPFTAVDIPAGGLATGAEEIKTMQEREWFGGMANAPMDPCYHLYCDTIDNINQDIIEQMGKGAGYVLQTLATNPELRNFLSGAV